MVTTETQSRGDRPRTNSAAAVVACCATLARIRVGLDHEQDGAAEIVERVGAEWRAGRRRRMQPRRRPPRVSRRTNWSDRTSRGRPSISRTTSDAEKSVTGCPEGDNARKSSRTSSIALLTAASCAAGVPPVSASRGTTAPSRRHIAQRIPPQPWPDNSPRDAATCPRPRPSGPRPSSPPQAIRRDALRVGSREVARLVGIAADVVERRPRRLDFPEVFPAAIREAQPAAGVVGVEERHQAARRQQRRPLVFRRNVQAEEVEDRWSRVDSAHKTRDPRRAVE